MLLFRGKKEESMKRKILTSLCAVMLLMACVFVPKGIVAKADEEASKPTIDISNVEIKQEYNQNDELEIEKSDILVSDSIDNAEALKVDVTLTLVSSDPHREIVNVADLESHYIYSLSVAGNYVLKISVTNSRNQTATVEKSFEVIDNSVINAKYENGGKAIDSSEFGDSALYGALLDWITAYAEDKGDKFTGTVITDIMFHQIDIKELVLDGSGVSSISGLAKLKLEYVETLSIVGGSISSVSASSFEGFKSDTDVNGTAIRLKNINFANNDISSFELPALRNLESLNLSSNNLTSLDLSKCWGYMADGEEASSVEINLAGNSFSSMNDISMPRADHISLNLIHNNLYAIDDAYFNNAKYSLNVGVQGDWESSGSTKLDSQNGLRYYKSNIEGLVVEIYDLNKQVPELVKSVSDNDVLGGNYININLPMGEYEYRYKLNGVDAYDRSDSNKSYYKPKTSSFIINPTKATYKYEYKGNITEELGKVTGTVKLHLYSYDIENGVNGKIMYRVNSGDWEEGNVVECSTGGTFSVTIKVVCGDYESEETSVLIRTSLNTVIPDIVMFFIVLFVGLMIFAVIMPIVSKKFFRK